jgi:DNA-binding NtrC family response regulator
VRENVLLFGRDSPFTLTLTERICSKKCIVHFAQSGPEALGILQRNDIDVVIININDLGVEGVQILDSMKQKQPPTEFITLTSPSTMLLSIEGMKRGVFADLLIPFDMEDLIVKIRDAGSRRRRQKRFD